MSRIFHAIAYHEARLLLCSNSELETDTRASVGHDPSLTSSNSLPRSSHSQSAVSESACFKGPAAMTCVGNLSFVARTTQTSQIVRILFWSFLRTLPSSAFAFTMAGRRLSRSDTALGAPRIYQRNPASLALIVRL